jgi:Fe-S cluster assembly iron-binding protein IscA
MALDEQRDSDEVQNEGGLIFLIEGQLFAIAKPIRIDFETTKKGGEFTISSAIAENRCSIAEHPGACYASCSI